jgi:hypothetical protein
MIGKYPMTWVLAAPPSGRTCSGCPPKAIVAGSEARIVSRAAELVHHGEVVPMDVGVTIPLFARALRGHRIPAPTKHSGNQKAK